MSCWRSPAVRDPSTSAGTALASSSCSVAIDQPPALQVGAQLLQAQPHAALDRAQRRVDHAGDLLLRVAAVVRQLDGLSLLSGQRAESDSYGVPFERLRDIAPGVRALAFGPDLDLQLHFRAFVERAPQVIDGAVADHGQQPGAK